MKRAVRWAMVGALAAGGLIPALWADDDLAQGKILVADRKLKDPSFEKAVVYLITYDDKGALITASFNEHGLDYQELFNDIQNLIKTYSDDNTDIYVAGQPVVSGWGYYYLARIKIIFTVSIALMLIILYISIGQRSS